MAGGARRQRARRSASSKASPRRLALIVKVFSGVLLRRLPQAQAAGACSATASPRVSKLAFPLAPSLGWIVGRALRRSRRQGHSRRAARCADRRHHARRRARRELRLAAGARHRRRASAGRCSRSRAMAYFAGNFQAAFWVAVDARGRCASRCWCRRATSPSAPTPANAGEDRVALADVRRLGRAYCDRRRDRGGADARALLGGVPRAARAGRRPARVGAAPWVMVVMSIVYALVAYPAGAAADRGHGPRAAVGRAASR